MQKLKACCNCGGIGKLKSYRSDGIHWGYYVSCENCGTHTYLCACERPAVEDWNQGYTLRRE